jgi:hypothetical protein
MISFLKRPIIIPYIFATILHLVLISSYSYAAKNTDNDKEILENYDFRLHFTFGQSSLNDPSIFWSSEEQEESSSQKIQP